jgi:hypothetical protein
MRWVTFGSSISAITRIDPLRVRSGEVIAHEILKDDANVGAHREQVVLAQIMPVEQNAAARGRVS